MRADKHCFYDKPAGDDFHRFMRVIEDAKTQNLQVTLGYMFRNHDGFERMANWVRSGFLGSCFPNPARTCRLGCRNALRAVNSRTVKDCRTTAVGFYTTLAVTCLTRSFG